jgi:CheY-like chemotaxis protein
VREANETLELRVEQHTAELTEAHEALRQAQKMEAVGQLTGGIAHDFNNLLAGISGSLELIERRLAEGRTAGLDRFITGAQSSARRAAALTQRLLAFSRRQTLDPKPIGKGTGLGLSMVHGFVRQSGGQVRVTSEPGHGTSMCLYLPRQAGESVEDSAVAGPDIAAHGAGRTVLVIDDEPMVRMLIVEMLDKAGFHALEAEDGPSGLQLLEPHPNIDLLVTDVGLPGGMNGGQVADAARQTRPDLKVLFVTGYAENAAGGNGLLDSGMEVITKPFVMTELAAKISEMIEG